MNGRLFDDNMGNYTCISNEGKSVVDYFLSNKNVFDIVSYFAVGERDESDHYPLLCILSFLKNLTYTVDHFMPLANYTHFKWKEQFSNDFSHNFQRYLFHNKRRIMDAIDFNIDDAVSKIISLYQKSWQRYNKPYRHNINVQLTEWWDADCESLKLLKYKCLRKFRKTNTDHDFRDYITNRNRFKAVCKRKKLLFQKYKRLSLVQNRSNPKEFWKLLKNSTKANVNTSASVSPFEFYSYFKSLLFDVTAPALTYDQSGDSGNPNADCLNNSLCLTEIEKAITSLANGKSVGIDGLPSEFIRQHCTKLPRFYTNFSIK